MISINDTTVSSLLLPEKKAEVKFRFSNLYTRRLLRINPKKVDLIIIGLSAGGVGIINTLIPSLKPDFSIPIVIVLHRSKLSDNYLVNILDERSRVAVKSAENNEILKSGVIYLVPPDCHLKFNKDKSICLTDDPPINFSRPSIDVTFESAAQEYKKRVIGIIMTGANFDGCLGLKKIKDAGGIIIAQNPEEAEISVMPSVAMKVAKVDLVMGLDQLIRFLAELNDLKNENRRKTLVYKRHNSSS